MSTAVAIPLDPPERIIEDLAQENRRLLRALHEIRLLPDPELISPGVALEMLRKARYFAGSAIVGLKP